MTSIFTTWLKERDILLPVTHTKTQTFLRNKLKVAAYGSSPKLTPYIMLIIIIKIISTNFKHYIKSYLKQYFKPSAAKHCRGQYQNKTNDINETPLERGTPN